jgi:hypothetical protein
MKNQIGKKVIVRADRAGVFYGTLSQKDGDEVQLKNARKLYYWTGANAVEEIAKIGVSDSGNQITVEVEEITVMQVIQILTCTEKAITNIENVEEWKKQ